jgi:Fe-S cluster assembly ATP-binding protein
MLKIDKLQARLVESQKEILHSASLQIKPGEVHYVRGRNGSGKSTLAAVLSGHPDFEATGGAITLEDEHYSDEITRKVFKDEKLPEKIDVLALEPNQRSLLGIFLANQYPLAIPGVNLSNFLRMAYNTRLSADMPVFKFRKLLKERAALINYPEHLLDRNLNEGFSGGEKKKTEILQMALLEPRYAILDETDSGLDQQAISDVFYGIQSLRKSILPNLSLLVITHYEKVAQIIAPDFEHEMVAGELD